MLQFITHSNDRFNHIEGAEEALKGGCRWIQLRMKGASKSEIVEVGVKLKALCQEYSATFIIDDHVDLVEEIGADGVHLGKSDMHPTLARQILGDDAVIGGTANTLEDIVELHRNGVNYIGLGPFRYTTTKSNLSPLLGLSGYREIMSGCRERGIDLPVVAIGGITKSDMAEIIATGVAGVALSGTILTAPSPMTETESIIEVLNNSFY